MWSALTVSPWTPPRSPPSAIGLLRLPFWMSTASWVLPNFTVFFYRITPTLPCLSPRYSRKILTSSGPPPHKPFSRSSSHVSCLAPFFSISNPIVPASIETDASDLAIGAVCSQPDQDGRLHPVAYYSRKSLPAELNYQIYDKELITIASAFKHWQHYLEFSPATTEVITDHRNLE